MPALFAYLSEKWSIILIGSLNCMFCFGFVNYGLCFVLHKKLPALRLAAGSLIIALVLNLPLYVVDYLFYYPELVGITVFSAMIYPNPLCLIVYYGVFRRVFRFSRSETLLGLEFAMLGYFIIMLFYMLFTDIWVSLLRIPPFSANTFATDSLAMLSTDIVIGVLILLLLRIVVKRDFFLGIPSTYKHKNNIRDFSRVFLFICGSYLLLASVSILIMTEHHARISINHALLYCILIGILSFRLIDGFLGNRLQIAQWQKLETDRYIDSLMKATNDFRGIKHDINNVLQIYEGYINAGNLEGLRQYHRSVLRLTTQVNEALEWIEALRPRMAIYNVLNLKIGHAQGLGVFYEVQGVGELCDVALSDLDLCRVLGNLLDNAIEACAKTDEKQLRMVVTRETETVSVHIANTTVESVELDRIYEDGYTTKFSHGGIGLGTVKRILAQHGDDRIATDCAEGWFHVRLVLGARAKHA